MNARSPKILAAIFIILMIAGNAAIADVISLKLEDQITPASAEVIVSAIARAERENSTALILTIDTPGGLETSMREIVSRIISSRIPIIVYVAPSGSHAASAGFVILLSADVAAMAPGTSTGAAHPVLIGGREMSKTMTEKIVNDAAAYVRSLAEKRNRDPQAAESTIRESRSFTDSEALDNHLIDIIARDEWDLLANLNGRSVTRFDGSRIILQTSNEKLTPVIPTFRQRLLMWLADPRITFVLFATGLLCVYFEFQHPGLIAPGVAGALAMTLALYGFHMLPINVTGVLLIALALTLFVLEAKVQGFGVLGLGGVISAVIGSLILVDVPDMRLPLSLVLAVIIPFALILILMVRLAFRARRTKITTGLDGMIGLKGRAETAIAPEGRVFVRGELWSARSQSKIAVGENVRVVGVNGLTLDVDLAERDAAVTPKQASAIDERG